MPRRKYAPRPLLLSYAVSTPTYTLRIDVSPEGIVSHCTPLVRHRWLGQDWATIREALEVRYGEALRITRPSYPRRLPLARPRPS